MLGRFWARSRLRALKACQRGAAALEFAFALPIVILVMRGHL